MSDKSVQSRTGRGNSREQIKTLEQSLKGQTTVLIGRGKECDVVVEDLKASRKHCRLTRKDDAFLLEDLASKNGTYVDGVKISAPVLLRKNQSFKIGDTIFYLAS